jgi:hypothetical protein
MYGINIDFTSKKNFKNNRNRFDMSILPTCRSFRVNTLLAFTVLKKSWSVNLKISHQYYFKI